jgi:hypothetical protein
MNRVASQDRPLAWHYALIVACALLVTQPLVANGPSCGHDFDFHLQSWLAASSAWHAGLLYPHWVPAANYGAGEPRFVFYPPLSWVLGALLGSVLRWTWVPQAFTFLVLAACGLSFYRLARAWVRPSIAAAAGCIYLAGPYVLFVAYERTAYGELLGAAVIPLVVRYALRSRPVLLSLAVAGLWFNNAPAAVMGCYLVALCAVAAALAARRLLPAVRGLAALVAGTGLAGVYVLPAWYEQRWVEIARVVGPGMRVEDSFLFGRTGEPFHDQVLHTASLIAVVVLGVGLVGVAVSWVCMDRAVAGEDAPRQPALHAVLAGGLVAILLLLLPISDAVWRYAPELHFLQFPWRWLLVASLLATLAGASAAEALAQRWAGSRARHIVSAVGVGVTLCIGAWGAGRYAQQHYAQFCDDEDNVRAQETLLAPNSADAGSAIAGFEGTDEYTPSGAENGEVQQGLPAVRLLAAPGDDEGDDSSTPNPPWQPGAPAPGSVAVSDWGPEHKRLTVQAPAQEFAVLRLMDYPAWRVRVNGRTLPARPHRQDGLLTVPVPAGTTTIDVTYRTTPDVLAGRVLSLLSLLSLAAWEGWTRRRQTPAKD